MLLEEMWKDISFSKGFKRTHQNKTLQNSQEQEEVKDKKVI